jgi:hypothetical protein
MIKYTVAAVAALLFVAASLLAISPDATASKSAVPGKSVATPAAPSSAQAKPSGSVGAEIPDVINIPSAAGEVVFQHQKHTTERSIKCVECHHQINAKKLTTPHPDYMTSSWIKCSICHKETSSLKQKIFACSACHHTNLANIADETLSTKVVVHKKCWNCHEAGTGVDASKSCVTCHTGKRSL